MAGDGAEVSKFWIWLGNNIFKPRRMIGFVKPKLAEFQDILLKQLIEFSEQIALNPDLEADIVASSAGPSFRCLVSAANCHKGLQHCCRYLAQINQDGQSNQF